MERIANYLDNKPDNETLITQLYVNISGWYYIDITNWAHTSHSAGNANLSILLVPNNPQNFNYTYFNSSESSSNIPTLNLTLTDQSGIPSTPTILGSTQGTFWINHTWQAEGRMELIAIMLV